MGNASRRKNTMIASPLTILIDIDGVLGELHTPWLAMYNNEFKDNLKVEDITTWNLDGFVKPACGRKIYEYLDLPLYKQVIPIAGAVDGVNALRKRGHQVKFVTHSWGIDRFDWLVKWGFLLEPWKRSKDLFFCMDKASIIGDVLIDDYEKNLTPRKLSILFDQPWNRLSWNPEAGNMVRAVSWTAIVKIVDKFVAETI
jgi:5'-nucleotidase